MMFAITIAPTTSEMLLMKARRAKAPAEIDLQTTWIASAVTNETGSGADWAVFRRARKMTLASSIEAGIPSTPPLAFT